MRTMEAREGYIPPLYVPLQQEDDEADDQLAVDEHPAHVQTRNEQTEWSSGICACFDDMQSCCVGAFCPCFLYGKNADFLGSGTLAGSCITHLILFGLFNCLCCLSSGGLLCGLPGSIIASFAGEYRRILRTKYNLKESPCSDFTTHACCHLCALCQEYREIRERSQGSNPVLGVPMVIAPPVQAMSIAPQIHK